MRFIRVCQETNMRNLSAQLKTEVKILSGVYSFDRLPPNPALSLRRAVFNEIWDEAEAMYKVLSVSAV